MSTETTLWCTESCWWCHLRQLIKIWAAGCPDVDVLWCGGGATHHSSLSSASITCTVGTSTSTGYSTVQYCTVPVLISYSNSWKNESHVIYHASTRYVSKRYAISSSLKSPRPSFPPARPRAPSRASAPGSFKHQHLPPWFQFVSFPLD